MKSIHHELRLEDNKSNIEIPFKKLLFGFNGFFNGNGQYFLLLRNLKYFYQTLRHGGVRAKRSPTLITNSFCVYHECCLLLFGVLYWF